MTYEAWTGMTPLVEVTETPDETLLQRWGARKWWICEYNATAATPFNCKMREHPNCRYRWVLP
jgi:hypothetical protein